MTINRLNVQDRFRIMPGLGTSSARLSTVTLYRTDAMDQVAATQTVGNVEVRSTSRQDSPTSQQPNKTKTRTFHLWVTQMNGWKIEEFDYINFSDEWWVVTDSKLDLLDSRYTANCKESSDPR